MGDGGVFARVGVEKGEIYWARVRGGLPDGVNRDVSEAVNIFDLIAVSGDDFGPQVTNVFITNHADFDLFNPKPSEGPTPAARSLTIELRDPPGREPGFLYEALNEAIASNPGHYLLAGDHHGVIPIQSVNVTNDPVQPPISADVSAVTNASEFASQDVGLSGADDFYNGATLRFTTGALAGQAQPIQDYSVAGNTKTFVFSDPFTVAPAVADDFVILQPATATIELVMHDPGPDGVFNTPDDIGAPLPDDRFTLTLADAIIDPAENGLDGESNAVEPQETPSFLVDNNNDGRPDGSGDGVPGGDFLARFTVDSRPEIGITSSTRVYVDINGNSIYDPDAAGDDTNRDLIFQFGLVSDAHFAGDFNRGRQHSLVGLRQTGILRLESHYPHLPVLTRLHPQWSAQLRFQRSGSQQRDTCGRRFCAGHPGDEIGLFTGDTWILDSNGNNVLDINEGDTVIPTAMRGIPVVGDVNGDGFDDLITYDAGADTFFIDFNRTGVVNDEIPFGFPDFVERPVVGDLNLDGVDDFGLWIAGSSDKIGEGKAEWHFLISDRVAQQPANFLPHLLFDDYSPDPLGNDLFANYGDRYSLPIFGNFDPPVAGTPAGHPLQYTNKDNPYDVNGDGYVSPRDALLVISNLNQEGSRQLPELMVEYDAPAPFLDVTGDGYLSPVDALFVIHHLNGPNDVDGEGEGESVAVPRDFAEDSGTSTPVTESFGALALSASSAAENDTLVTSRIHVAVVASDVPTASPLALTGQAEQPSTITQMLDGEDDELEDLLELIADDVQSQWWKL